MKNWFIVLFFLLMSGVLVYFNSLNNKFIIDDNVFTNNPILSNTKYIFCQWDPYREQKLGVIDSSDNFYYYRPLAHMVLDFCYAAFKKSYWKYHLFNLSIFAFASSLIYVLIKMLTGNFYLGLLTAEFLDSQEWLKRQYEFKKRAFRQIDAI